MNRKLAFLLIVLLLIPCITYAKTDNSLESVKQEYLRLQQWEKNLAEKENRLKKIELDIVKKEEKLKDIKRDISNIYNEIKKIRDANVKELAVIYSKMKPEQSSQIINKMDEKLAVKIFLKMQPNKTAKILNLVNKEKAVKITEMLALYGIKINIGGR